MEVFRHDVSTYFKMNDELDASGFETRIQKNVLKRGVYQIGFYLRKRNGKEGVFKFSEEYIKK